MVWQRLFRRYRPDELALIDADITAFGEELARHVFVPTGQDTDALVLGDYERALEAYERAKHDFVGDRNREDADDVMRALEEGRYALARAEARAAGRPLPSRRPLCFFDPRHGPSTTEVRWTPPGGAPRSVAVCAADAVRLAEGHAPLTTGRPPEAARTVHPSGPAYRADPRPVRGGTGAQPLPGKGANWRPYKVWPPGTPAGQRVEASGDREAELVRPDAGRPVILVVRMDNAGSVELLDHPGKRHLLKRGGQLRRTVVPLPPNGAETVRVKADAYGRWRAWLQPLDDRVPVLESRLSSKGPYVFRYLGGPATVRVGQRNGGAFWLEELTDGFEPGERLVAGKGTFDGEGRLNGPAVVHVRSSSDWHVTLMG